LRQRVADRKAGIRDTTDPGRARLIGRVKLLANLFQGVGLAMLVVILVRYFNSGFEQMNWINVMIYSAMFLIGRVVIVFLNLNRMMR